FLAFHLPNMQQYLRYLGGPRTLRSSVAQILVRDGTMLSLVHPDEHADCWKMTVRGTLPLWSQITMLIDLSEDYSRPRLEQSEVCVNQQGEFSIHLKA